MAIAKFDWNQSNGSATAEQTQRAYQALISHGRTDNFAINVWTDIVNKIIERRALDGVPWDTYYDGYHDGFVIHDRYRSQQTIQAGRHHWGRYPTPHGDLVIDRGFCDVFYMACKNIPFIKFKPPQNALRSTFQYTDKLKGAYFLELVNEVNRWIDATTIFPQSNSMALYSGHYIVMLANSSRLLVVVNGLRTNAHNEMTAPSSDRMQEYTALHTSSSIGLLPGCAGLLIVQEPMKTTKRIELFRDFSIRALHSTAVFSQGDITCVSPKIGVLDVQGRLMLCELAGMVNVPSNPGRAAYTLRMRGAQAADAPKSRLFGLGDRFTGTEEQQLQTSRSAPEAHQGEFSIFGSAGMMDFPAKPLQYTDAFALAMAGRVSFNNASGMGFILSVFHELYGVAHAAQSRPFALDEAESVQMSTALTLPNLNLLGANLFCNFMIQNRLCKDMSVPVCANIAAQTAYYLGVAVQQPSIIHIDLFTDSQYILDVISLPSAPIRAELTDDANLYSTLMSPGSCPTRIVFVGTHEQQTEIRLASLDSIQADWCCNHAMQQQMHTVPSAPTRAKLTAQTACFMGAVSQQPRLIRIDLCAASQYGIDATPLPSSPLQVALMSDAGIHTILMAQVSYPIQILLESRHLQSACIKLPTSKPTRIGLVIATQNKVAVASIQSVPVEPRDIAQALAVKGILSAIEDVHVISVVTANIGFSSAMKVKPDVHIITMLNMRSSVAASFVVLKKLNYLVELPGISTLFSKSVLTRPAYYTVQLPEKSELTATGIVIAAPTILKAAIQAKHTLQASAVACMPQDTTITLDCRQNGGAHMVLRQQVAVKADVGTAHEGMAIVALLPVLPIRLHLTIADESGVLLHISGAWHIEAPLCTTIAARCKPTLVAPTLAAELEESLVTELSNTLVTKLELTL